MLDVGTSQQVNASSNSTFHGDQARSALPLLYTAYIIIMVVSMVTNSLMVYIVYWRMRSRSPTSSQFASMAIADLITTAFSMPIWSYFICIEEWVEGLLGNLLCSLAASTSIMTSLASLQTLMAVSVERFIGICFPLRRAVVTARNNRRVTRMIWAVSVAMAAPAAFLYTVHNSHGRLRCVNNLSTRNPELRKVYYTVIFALMFGLPVLVMSILYILIAKKLWSSRIPGQQSDASRRAARRRKQSILRMLVILVLAFVGCWLPVHIEWFMEVYQSTARREEQAIVLAHAYSALNPVLFFLFNGRFRDEFIKILRLHCCFKPTSFVREHPNTTGSVFDGTEALRSYKLSLTPSNPPSGVRLLKITSTHESRAT
ncbi:predicted protein [Nematostella vectensis]|uniref:G-protein coupled receptors family 1 profile domain-containing protein n=1 Tax=Nematostella vectensis TaxID=45351 RepID=A7RN95_NEMVE|nr:predicted protein [Nematostella vectensis]|eukprot:XP_001639088.1 predicted protein [Nematostella vectensis]